MSKQIIAIGGGGFFNEKCKLKIEKYLLKQTKKKRPKVCLLPQARNEARDYIVKFYDVFTKLGAEPSWVSLFGRVENTWKKHLLEQDLIYVGGGNTKSMIALWKAWEMDKILYEAYNKGIILSGSSAGGICWFEQGITDSVWPLGIVDGLGFLKGSYCPHFETETERQEVYRNHVKNKTIKPGIASDEETACHFINGKLHQVITGIAGKKIIHLKIDREKTEPAILL
jgi:dipeptidase E